MSTVLQGKMEGSRGRGIPSREFTKNATEWMQLDGVAAMRRDEDRFWWRKEAIRRVHQWPRIRRRRRFQTPLTTVNKAQECAMGKQLCELSSWMIQIARDVMWYAPNTSQAIHNQWLAKHQLFFQGHIERGSPSKEHCPLRDSVNHSQTVVFDGASLSKADLSS